MDVALYAIASGFLSTPSARRATSMPRTSSLLNRNFYPRPPRGGRPTCTARPVMADNFYPRPPRGGRLFRDGVILSLHIFLSTPSARRATSDDVKLLLKSTISIHALREEGDVTACNLACVLG